MYLQAYSDLVIISDQNGDQKFFNNASINENSWAGSLARLGHLLDVQKVAGSNPARPIQGIIVHSGESGKVNIDNLYHLVMIRVVSNKRFEPFINYTSR